MILKKLFFLLSIFLCSQSSFAQLDLPTTFVEKMEAATLEINVPLENRYKDIAIKKNDFQQYDLAIWSKKEKLEIRYSIEPFLTDTPLNTIPHLQCMKVISNVATNDQDAVVSVHNMSQKELSEEFNADWGAVAYFQPKPEFGDYEHCKMLALFKEGKATAYVFFLFNKASELVDQRFYALRFIGE